MELKEIELNRLLKSANASRRKAWRLTFIFSFLPILLAGALVVDTRRLLVRSETNIGRLSSELDRQEQETLGHKRQLAILREELEMKNPDLIAYKEEIESLRNENLKKTKEAEENRKRAESYKKAYIAATGNLNEIDRNLRQLPDDKKTPQVRQAIEVIEGAKRRNVDFP